MAAPLLSPALSTGTHYPIGRGEIVAFGRPAAVAADDGAGEPQRWRSDHRVLLCPEGGRRFQLAGQPATEPGRAPAVGPRSRAGPLSPGPRRHAPRGHRPRRALL